MRTKNRDPKGCSTGLDRECTWPKGLGDPAAGVAALPGLDLRPDALLEVGSCGRLATLQMGSTG
jgi:hypothetical protein